MNHKLLVKPLEERLFLAGEATEQPPLPEKGIPSQSIPTWIGTALKWFFLPFVLLDVLMQKWAKKLIVPPYVQAGTCKKRGNCCHYIMIRKPKGIWGRLFIFWNTQIHGFYPHSDEEFEYEKQRVLVMGCRYLRKDGSCGQYRLRPMVCRKWPIIEHFGHPRILKGCGFRAVLRHQNKELPGSAPPQERS